MKPKILHLKGNSQSGATTALILMLKYSIETKNCGLNHLIGLPHRDMKKYLIDDMKNIIGGKKIFIHNDIITYRKRGLSKIDTKISIVYDENFHTNRELPNLKLAGAFFDNVYTDYWKRYLSSVNDGRPIVVVGHHFGDSCESFEPCPFEYEMEPK